MVSWCRNPKATAPVDTTSELHDPYARRATMSRPLLSQPSRYPGAVPSFAKGPFRAHDATTAFGLPTGRMPSCAVTATATMNTIQPIASHAASPSPGPL